MASLAGAIEARADQVPAAFPPLVSLQARGAAALPDVAAAPEHAGGKRSQSREGREHIPVAGANRANPSTGIGGLRVAPR
eukprot:4156147-Pyramimonas_sp.AAC.1